MSVPYFSIVLPVYNVEPYLPRCIQSIIEQDFSDYEVILVDDGSTDGCPKLCDRYAERYKNIYAVHKSNGGLSSARNEGLKVCKGKYVFFIDSDDWIQKGALTFLYQSACKSQADIIKFDFTSTKSGQEIHSIIPEGSYDKKAITEQLIPLVLTKMGKVNFSAWSHLYRMEFIKNERLTFISEREIGSEDYLFNLQAYLSASKIEVSHDSLYFYDFREGSLTKRYRKNLIHQYEALYQYFISAVKEKGLYPKYKQELLCFYIWKSFSVTMQNECVITPDHPVRERDKNVKELLGQKALREALSAYAFMDEGIKQKIILFFMRWRIKGPLIYLLSKGLKIENEK